MSFPRQRLRIKVDVSTREMAVDVIGQQPSLWRGSATDVEVAFFNSTALVTDFTTVSTITLEIRDYSSATGVDTGSPIVAVTLTAAEINDALTEEEWDAGTAAHAKFTLTPQNANLDVGTTGVADYWLDVYALSTGSPGEPYTYGASVLRVYEDGAGTGGTAVPPPDPPTYLTIAESDARYLRANPDPGSLRINASGNLQLWNPDTGKWHTIIASGAVGSVGLVVDQTGEA
jgi:hypothetical protein